MTASTPGRTHGRGGRGAVARAAVAVAVAFLAASMGRAQAPTAALSLGLGGQLVVDAWNPVRVTLRDLPSARLELRLDAGSLLEGPRPVGYRADIRGGSGVTVYEDDVYLPAFRNLSWTLRSGDAVVASGSLGSREADPRPLDLILSSAPGRWRSALGADARVVDVAASELPTRAAAFDGARSLVIDGSSAAPRAAAVAAAAAGGVTVVLAGPLPASYAGLEPLLAGADAAALGAGGVVRSPARGDAVARALERRPAIDRSALTAALAGEPLVAPPTTLPQPLLLGVAAVFVLTVLASLRFGGAPGVLAALALTAVVGVAGWRVLHPPAPMIEGSRTLSVGAGGLALRSAVREVLTLPAGEVDIAQVARPIEPRSYRTDDHGTHVALERWHRAVLVERPTLVEAALRIEDGALVNAGDGALHDVYVVGAGAQPPLPAGARMRPRQGEDAYPAGPFPGLAAVLPAGTALALDIRGDVWVALPPWTAARAEAP